MEKLQQIESRIKSMEIYDSIIVAAIGLAVLLFGYKLKKLAFFIIWFLIGYNIMLLLMPVLNDAIPAVGESQMYQILLPIAGGLLMALLGFSIEKLCVAGICFFLVMLIAIQYFGTDVLTLVIGAIIGAVAAASATAMIKPAIIIATSIAGGWALTLALLNIFPVLDVNVMFLPMLAAFAVLGAIFQFATTKHSD